MNSKNQALINYYARLIIKDRYVLSDVQENLQEQVAEAIEVLKKKDEESEGIDK